MTLSDYIKAQRGNATALAEKLGISLSNLSQIAHDSKGTSPSRCVAIEQATDGLVTRQELRQDWEQIWPELAYCPCSKKSKGKAKAAAAR
jgi:DNA-binding transcriptional regulator YdaS (Cro superfamily)